MIFRANSVRGNAHFLGEKFTYMGIPLGFIRLIFASFHFMFSLQFTEAVGSVYGLADNLC